MPKLKNCHTAIKAPNYLTRIQCLVCFYFIRVIAKPSSTHISIKIIQDRAEITATIKLDDKKHLNISRKRSVIYL